MTVTYSLDVCTTKLSGFARLLLRWRGSIYRLVYREFILFIVAYYGLAVIYRVFLNPTQQQDFESLVKYFRKFTDNLPMTFILSFYVALVLGRWWDQFMWLPWPDRANFAILSFIQGSDERGRIIRRTLCRYLNLMAVLTLNCVSSPVKKRFPTLDHIVDAGIMTAEEKELLESVPSPYGLYFHPAIWFMNLVTQAKKERRLADDIHFKTLHDELMSYRLCCGMVFCYDWISVPLVYTQAVTIAVYTYFISMIFGRQFLYIDDDNANTEGSLARYVPLLTLFQFFFFAGWLKTAEQLLNPLGEDDDDFEMNFLIDRNIQTSFLIVDTLHGKYPKLEKDTYWNYMEPDVPYTEAAPDAPEAQPFLGSVHNMNISRGIYWKPSRVEFSPSDDFEPGPGLEDTRKFSRKTSRYVGMPTGGMFTRAISSTDPGRKLSNWIRNRRGSEAVERKISRQISKASDDPESPEPRGVLSRAFPFPKMSRKKPFPGPDASGADGTIGNGGTGGKIVDFFTPSGGRRQKPSACDVVPELPEEGADSVGSDEARPDDVLLRTPSVDVTDPSGETAQAVGVEPRRPSEGAASDTRLSSLCEEDEDREESDDPPESPSPIDDKSKK